MPSNIEEIKQKIDIVDLVAGYVKLTPAGSALKGLCPFHKEKTPSFMVSPDRQIWHCFGCGLGGDHFKFIQQIEGLDFPEALRLLAYKAGVKLADFKPEEHNLKTHLLDICQAAAVYWHGQLKENSSAVFVREYLNKRGVSAKAVDDFILGYAVNAWDDLIRYLQNKNYSLKEIFDAGLSVIGDKGKPYDRFRNRLMFPIRDSNGAVVGFTGRKMDENDLGGKYVNSPQTLIYNKSRILYNLDLAKTEIKRLNYVILVEGNMDAISCFEAGTKNAVAVSGTALTDEQIKMIKRFTNNIMIAFDSDEAGTIANFRGIDLAWQAGLNVKVINLAGKKDPDELIKANLSLWKELVKTAENFMDYLFGAILAKYDLTRIDHKKEAAKKLLVLIAKLGDDVEKAHYIKKLACILEVGEDVLAKAIIFPKASNQNASAMVKEEEKNISNINAGQILAEHFLGILLKFPMFFNEIAEKIEPKYLIYPPAIELYKTLLVYYNKCQHLNIHKALSGELSEEKQIYFNRLYLFDDSALRSADPILVKREILLAGQRLAENYLRGEQSRVGKLIKKAEELKDYAEADRLAGEFNEIIKLLSQFNIIWQKKGKASAQ